MLDRHISWFGPRPLFSLLALLASLALASPLANACEVARGPTIQELFAAADEVYVGVVSEVRHVPYRESIKADGTGKIEFPVDIAKVGVSRLFKGKDESTKSVYQVMMGDCGIALPSGRDCLLFTKQDNGAQVVAFAGAICDLHSLFSSEDHKQFLRSVEQMKALSSP